MKRERGYGTCLPWLRVSPLEGGVFMLGEGGVGCVIEGEGGV